MLSGAKSGRVVSGKGETSEGVVGAVAAVGSQFALKTIVMITKATKSVQVTRFKVVSAVLALVNNWACPPMPPIPSPLGLWSKTRATNATADADQRSCTKPVMFIT